MARELKQIGDIVDLRKQGLLVGEEEIAQYRARAVSSAASVYGGKTSSIRKG